MNGRLTVYQQKLINGVKRIAPKRAKKTVRKFCRERGNDDQIRKAIEILTKSPIIIHLFLEPIAEHLLRDGVLMNNFELKQDRPERWIAEYTIYGATPEVGRTLFYMDESEHPVYGTIHYTGNQAGMYNISKLYGESWLELEEHIKEDCTFTPIDSFQVYREQVFTWATIEGVLASKCFHKYWCEYILDNEVPFPTGGSLPGYIEVQILGRVRLKDDVKCIHYPIRFNHNLELVKILQQIAQKYDCVLKVF